MHLFRWVRYLSPRHYRCSSTRRSSCSILRRFHDHQEHHARQHVTAPMVNLGTALHQSSFSSASPADDRVRSGSASGERRSSLSSRSRDSERRRRRQRDEGHPQPLFASSPRSSTKVVAFPRVSSIFQPARRSTIMERASIANLFNDLEFEMPSLSNYDPVPTSPTAIELTYPLNVPLSRKESKRLQKMMKKASKKQVMTEADEKEPGWLRQYWSATTKRPLSEMQCNDYLQDFGGMVADPTPYSTTGSRTSASNDSPPPRMEFLFFGGSSDESVHSKREIGADLRRHRAHFMAQRPVPSCTRSIPVKPTLVRNLPPVFEPTLTCMLY